MIRTMGVALRSLDRGPIAHPRPDRIYPSFADFQSVSGSKISNIYSRELFAFTEISQGAKRGLKPIVGCIRLFETTRHLTHYQRLHWTAQRCGLTIRLDLLA